MTRSRLLLISFLTIGFVVAATPFRSTSPSPSTSAVSAAGSLDPATPMPGPARGTPRLCCRTEESS
ncbi:MAG TPA: hypothetical protein VIX37_19850 [Candidatus Sulfotelmatobacter sp.]